MFPNLDSGYQNQDQTPEIPKVPEQSAYSKVADEFSADIRAKSKEFARVAQDKWLKLKPLFTYIPETEMFELPWDLFEKNFYNDEELFKPMKAIVSTEMRRAVYRELRNCTNGVSLVSGSIRELEIIIDHDIMHLPPRTWLYDSLAQFKIYEEDDKKIIRIPKEWMEFYDEAVRDAEKLTNVVALVVDYSKEVIENLSGRKVEEKPFKLADTLTNIGRIIKGRFSFLDFDLLINPSQEDLDKFDKNRIVINVDPDLELTTAESFIFADIYNLVKNSAKSLDQKTDKELSIDTTVIEASPNKKYRGLDTVLKNRIEHRKKVERPNQIVISANLSDDSLVLTVDDTGVGLSLDGAMEKIVSAMNIATDLNTNLESSTWFNAVKALGFARDAELLLAWSQGDHYAFRMVTIGAILGIQHLIGYQAEAWNLQNFTSGLGLLSVNFLAGILGGKVLATNKYNGGAFFTLSLPKASVGLIDEIIDSIW